MRSSKTRKSSLKLLRKKNIKEKREIKEKKKESARKYAEWKTLPYEQWTDKRKSHSKEQ